MNRQKTPVLKEKNKLGGPTLPNSKTYYKATVLKMRRYYRIKNGIIINGRIWDNGIWDGNGIINKWTGKTHINVGVNRHVANSDRERIKTIQWSKGGTTEEMSTCKV